MSDRNRLAEQQRETAARALAEMERGHRAEVAAKLEADKAFAHHVMGARAAVDAIVRDPVEEMRKGCETAVRALAEEYERGDRTQRLIAIGGRRNQGAAALDCAAEQIAALKGTPT